MMAGFEFGDDPGHGGWAQRCKKKVDRSLKQVRRAHRLISIYEGWKPPKRVKKWVKVHRHWRLKLLAELIRQEPRQKGWEEP